MPTLYRWFQSEYSRLRMAGKGHLADEFETYRQTYFDYDYPAVLDMIPRLQRMCDELDEPGIRLLVDYYWQTAEAYWLGNLAKGLDIATQTLVNAHRSLGGNTVPELYTRLSLLYKWLDTDGPGYAPDVLEALKDIPDGLPIDLALRFELLHSYVVLQTDAEAGLNEVLGILPRLGYDWRKPYRSAIRADALLEIGRYDEALEDFQQARQGFEEINHHIQSVAMQISIGEVYLRSERYEEALPHLHAAQSATDRTLNQALSAQVRGFIGQARGNLGDPGEAVSLLNEALNMLDGLGWLRSEAKFAVDRWRFARQDENRNEADVQAWQADARMRAGRLRAGDVMQTIQDMESD